MAEVFILRAVLLLIITMALLITITGPHHQEGEMAAECPTSKTPAPKLACSQAIEALKPVEETKVGAGFIKPQIEMKKIDTRPHHRHAAVAVVVATKTKSRTANPMIPHHHRAVQEEVVAAATEARMSQNVVHASELETAMMKTRRAMIPHQHHHRRGALKSVVRVVTRILRNDGHASSILGRRTCIGSRAR